MSFSSHLSRVPAGVKTMAVLTSITGLRWCLLQSCFLPFAHCTLWEEVAMCGTDLGVGWDL